MSALERVFGSAAPEPGAVAKATTDPSGASPADGPLAIRKGVRLLVLYAVVVLGFSLVALVVELALGDPFSTGRSPGVSRSFEDAAWHLVTGLAIAVPTRRRALIVLTPVFALAIDVDHVFGSLLPTVVPREAHDLFFLVAIALVFLPLAGRAWTQLAIGATLVHLGADGGSFPLLAPVTTQSWAFPFAVAVVTIVAAALLVGLSGRTPRELVRPAYLVPTAAAVVVILLAGFAVGWIQVFSGA